jgi:quercetin dioxygenase-like cupin family protein
MTHLKNQNIGVVTEQEKEKIFIIVESIEYVSNSVVIKTILKKTTGNVTVSSFDTGEALGERNSAVDTFILVIDGKAEIVINDKSHQLSVGESIIIPAHSRNIIKANERFKIITTIIKSGYDTVSV